MFYRTPGKTWRWINNGRIFIFIESCPFKVVVLEMNWNNEQHMSGVSVTISEIHDSIQFSVEKWRQPLGSRPTSLRIKILEHVNAASLPMRTLGKALDITLWWIFPAWPWLPECFSGWSRLVLHDNISLYFSRTLINSGRFSWIALFLHSSKAFLPSLSPTF